MTDWDREPERREYSIQLTPGYGIFRAMNNLVKGKLSILTHLSAFDNKFLLSCYLLYQAFFVGVPIGLTCTVVVKGLEALLN